MDIRISFLVVEADADTCHTNATIEQITSLTRRYTLFIM
mgnify:CR=1 FL=1